MPGMSIFRDWVLVCRVMTTEFQTEGTDKVASVRWDAEMVLVYHSDNVEIQTLLRPTMRSDTVFTSSPIRVILVCLMGWGFIHHGLHRSSRAQAAPDWLAHDMDRPRPQVVSPAPQQLPVPPPQDAIVLFDGTTLDQWRSQDGGPAGWKVENGAMISVPNSGYVFTARPFGDVQLHLEWAAPFPVDGSGQGRGNSGVFLMSKYEIQILDSYRNNTYADGQAAAVYGQFPPLVNACLPPGKWQAFDIVFRRPRFHRDGRLASPARMTVIQNGVLVQDNVELWGPTNWLQHSPYEYHPDRLPLALQDHGNPIRFRNIWLRELSEQQELGPGRRPSPRTISLAPKELEPYAGRYRTPHGEEFVITLRGDHLRAKFYRQPAIELVPRSKQEFALRWTAARVLFDLDGNGQPTGFVLEIGGDRRAVKRVE